MKGDKIMDSMIYVIDAEGNTTNLAFERGMFKTTEARTVLTVADYLKFYMLNTHSSANLLGELTYICPQYIGVMHLPPSQEEKSYFISGSFALLVYDDRTKSHVKAYDIHFTEGSMANLAVMNNVASYLIQPNHEFKFELPTGVRFDRKDDPKDVCNLINKLTDLNFLPVISNAQDNVYI